jgi:hypothetical protein
MGVQDRDWYHKDREKKERRAQGERDPRTTEYHPKQFRRSRQVKAEHGTTAEKNSQAGMHWLVQLVWWIAGAMTCWLAYLFVITWR